MPNVAFGNLKGGVGKTTLAVNIACALAEFFRVRLVDADPQATAYEWHRAGNMPFQAEYRPLGDDGDPSAWLAAIKPAADEIVLLDLPPTAGPAVAAAMMASDLFVVPCTPSVLDDRATRKALAALRAARAARGGLRPRVLLVPSRVDRRLLAGRAIEHQLYATGELLGPAVGMRAAFVNSAVANTWVGAHAPGSEAHQEISFLAGAVKHLLSHLPQAPG